MMDIQAWVAIALVGCLGVAGAWHAGKTVGSVEAKAECALTIERIQNASREHRANIESSLTDELKDTRAELGAALARAGQTRTVVRTVTEYLDREPIDPDCAVPDDVLGLLNDARRATEPGPDPSAVRPASD